MASSFFPPLDQSSEEGLLAIGGFLDEEILLDAYRNGIFPWGRYEGELLWWSPDPRMVLYPDEFKISKSFRNILNRNLFEIRINTNFDQVIKACAFVERKEEDSTWIDEEFILAYNNLHKLGKAISFETYFDGQLVGGLYGVDVFPVFCGESMFSKQSNASKVALYYLVEYLKEKGYKIIDVQQETAHLSSLGARLIPRSEFIKILA